MIAVLQQFPVSRASSFSLCISCEQNIVGSQLFPLIFVAAYSRRDSVVLNSYVGRLNLLSLLVS